MRARCMTLFVQKKNMGDTCVVDPFDAVFDTATNTDDVDVEQHVKGVKKNKRKQSSDNPAQQLKRIARANVENGD